ncbi:Peptidase S8 [Ralstonia mannitolilytica]|nr:peptidase S8 [Ralstonia mannitolilytica]MBU9577379.1 S8 family serine peptidase [Ralstonia mannitolilytica]PLT17500.1 peptidase S8 [Ralstonia mannitolilytica]QIF09392.1 S8 family serine peptidase [Ralstonia mannitolilytica]CAJ0731820.1 Microbial serine proteinase [Ralstonia mannitolilytica]
MKDITGKTLALTLFATVALAACGGGDSGSNTASNGGGNNGGNTPPASTCAETGVDAKYACQTGSTEPLYAYQWALRQANSFFAAFGLVADGTTDIDVEDVHRAGVKGQGVNVLVLDDGIDVHNEDLFANANSDMTHNFDDGSNDPTPADNPANIKDAHGTNVAGIIAAAQNGKGVMGIAPRATLGGARYLRAANPDINAAYGGAAWSKNGHIINASYGANPQAPLEYDTPTSAQTAVRAFPNLRGGRGMVMLKAAGNEYDAIVVPGQPERTCPAAGGVPGLVSCENPANDPEALEPGVILVGAANARGVKASYSNAGSVNWITGLGGESGNGGKYGEVGSGPKIFSTDLSGCARGYSRANTDELDDFAMAGTATNLKDNPKCDYSSMNGTSAATPTVSGVVALMLSANPNLTWRDVREILRATARKIDPDYGNRDGRNAKIDLTSNTTTADTSTSLVDGATTARLDYGWQTNAAGYAYSTWYGFGLIDASAAVKMAKATTTYKPAALSVPDFAAAFANVNQLNYGAVQKLGQFNVSGTDKVDALQLRVSGSVCIGSVGFFVKSPSGTVSALSLPYNGYYNNGVNAVNKYGLGSYAFYGENAAGTWEVYAVSGVPTNACSTYQPQGGTHTVTLATPLAVEYRVIAAK